MARSLWIFSLALILSGVATARAAEPIRWTPDESSLEQSIQEALADRDSQMAAVRVVYRPGYFPYRAFYRPYYGVGYSYFPASTYIAPAWGLGYGFPYYAGFYSPFYTYTTTSYYPPSYYAPSYIAPAAYYGPPAMLVGPPLGYCGCYYW